MVIKNKRNMAERFDSISYGDVFIYEKYVFMKIESVYDYNTVNLSDGSLCCFNSEDIVQTVKCELIIE